MGRHRLGHGDVVRWPHEKRRALASPPLSDAALVRLRIIPRITNNCYIICGRDPGKHLTGLGRSLKRVLKRAGLENIRIHDLRRTVGSWLAQDGKSLHLIGDVLNHRDPKTTAGYAYFQTQQRREALTNHGDRALTFAPTESRIPAEPKQVRPAGLLAQSCEVDPRNNQPARQRHYFKREALYELAWTAPVTEVASRLGVSDVAFAKLRRRAAIPLPGRGFWARVEAGQVIPPLPLPPAPQGLPELLRIRGRRELTLDAPKT
jgi:hypothetical protein